MLREEINASGLKLGFLAETLGVSRYSLLNKIKNLTEFKPSEITALCNVLGITQIEKKEEIFLLN